MRLSYKDLKGINSSLDLWFETPTEFNTWVQRYKQALVKVDERSEETSNFYHHTFILRNYACLVKCHVYKKVDKDGKTTKTTNSTETTDKVDM